jgi:EPS-associated MarR family transcriptional regulator
VTSKRSKLQKDTHFRVLRLLQDGPETSQRKLAEVIGAINYLLNALLNKGLVKLGNVKAAEDMRRYAYALMPKGTAHKAALTRAFLVRKMEECDALKDEIEALSSQLEIEVLEICSPKS